MQVYTWCSMPIPLTKQKNKFEEWKFYRFLNFAEEHTTRGWFFFFFFFFSSIVSLVYFNFYSCFYKVKSWLLREMFLWIYIYIYTHTHKLKNRFSVTLSFAPKRSSDRKFLCYLSFIYIRHSVCYRIYATGVWMSERLGSIP